MLSMPSATVQRLALFLCLILQALVTPCLPCPCQLVGAPFDRQAEFCQTHSAGDTDHCCTLWDAAKEILRLPASGRADPQIAAIGCVLFCVPSSAKRPPRGDCAAMPRQDTTLPDLVGSQFLRE
jgi:hypothetical protein